MAYKTFDDSSINQTNSPQQEQISLKIDGAQVTVPDASFIKNASIARDGSNLVLEGTDSTVTIEGYYTVETTPDIVSADGATLTPALVNSFSTDTVRFASAESSVNDVSPVGSVNEVSGEATVTRLDGSTETITTNTPIYQGDIIETNANGAVNIVFQDETSFAVSDNARLAIDEYVYDPATDAGTTNFSVLKGVFVFTSGLIGREDPDDVHIETPLGSIGIRGTIIAGDVNQGEITVVEGAIVLNDFNGNEITLANQFETARFGTNGGDIEHMGQLAANDVAGRFQGVSGVAPDLFSSINDAAGEAQEQQETAQDGEESAQQTDDQEAQTEETEDQAQDSEQNAQQEQEATPEEEGKEAEQSAEENANEQGEETEARGEEAKEANKENQPDQQGQNEQNQQNTATESPHFGENAGQQIGGEALNSSLGTHNGAAQHNQNQNQQQNHHGANNQPPPNALKPNDSETDRPAGDNDNNTAGTGNSFTLNTVATSIEENTTGTIGTISVPSGVNGAIITSITLNGLASNFVDAIQNGTSWDLVLKSGVSLDFEDGIGQISYTATITGAPDGTTTITDHFAPIVTGVNEDTNHHYSETAESLISAAGQTYTYDFGKDFHDPEGNLTFSIGNITAKADTDNDGTFGGTGNSETLLGIDVDGGGLSASTFSETNTITDFSQLIDYLDFTKGTGLDDGASNTGWDFDSATGQLTLYFQDSNFANNLILDFDITTTDDDSNTKTASYTIDTSVVDYDHSGEATGISDTLTEDNYTKILTNYDDDYTLSAAAGNNAIFTKDGEDDINILGGSTGGNFIDAGDKADTITLSTSNASNNIIKGGAGDDSFLIQNNAGGSGYNILIGGTGNDTFNIRQGANNEYFGSEGNDSFAFDIGNYADVLNDLREGGSYQSFNGGTGFDEIRINGNHVSATDGTLDFTNIADTTFKNIESINLSDSEDYIVKLTANDIFEMTNHENVLRIDGTEAGGDSVDFTNDSGKTFMQEADEVIDGDTFHTYSNGEVTLVIDTDITVTGLPV